jgi:two-component system cell cycle sensor histidine kinase/response regulator CckA
MMPEALQGEGPESQRLRDDGRQTMPLVWAALERGDWHEVEARFLARGELFATYGINIDLWADLVLMGQELSTPLIVNAYADNPVHLGKVLSVMQAFWRRAVSVARKRYVETAAKLANSQRLALRRSEARYRALAESGIVGTMIADTTGRILEANETFLRMLGYTSEDVASGKLRWDELTPPEWEHVSRKALAELAAGGVARPREKRYRRRDGTLVPVLVGVAALDPPQTITFVLDLSERQRLEEQLRQSQKLEAIGSLAGGVAHDFNNLLSVILSNCDLLLEDLDTQSPIHEEIREIRHAGERATALTAQLLAFSRKQVLRPRVIELADVVRGMEPLIRRLVGSPIQPMMVLPASRCPVFADPHQIEQVLMNLIVNARDAMAEGGTLTVALGLRDVEPDEAEFLDLMPMDYVVLQVRDTGAGMDAGTRQRIFEPFFSTKGDRGTGLGLSTAFGIVRQHEGTILVDSEPGQGTTFTVLLPVTVRPPESQPPPEKKINLGGHETILLVEDEDDVRRVMVEVLTRHGYEILPASHGQEAI